jgi:hypothetical protein
MNCSRQTIKFLNERFICQGDQLKIKNKIKMAFEKWIESVNVLLFANYGVLISDLPDEPFWDYFEDNLSPKNVVDIMVANNLELL